MLTKSNVLYYVSLFLGLWIGLLVVWNRGLYLDDYSYREFSQDIATATWKPTFTASTPYVRELGQILISNTAAAIPNYEFWVRFAWMLIHGACVILLITVVYRITRSTLVSGITGWVYVAPFLAHEAVLWHVQIVHQVGNLCFLLALYLAVTIFDRQVWSVPRVIAAAVLVEVGLQFSELSAPAIFCLPFLSALNALRDGRLARVRSWLRDAIDLVVIALAVCFLHYLAFTGRSVSVEGRGGISLNPADILQNYNKFIQTIYWYVFDPTWGILLLRSSLKMGGLLLLQQWGYAIIWLLMIGLGVAWVLRMKLPQAPEARTIWLALGMAGFGLYWMGVALLPGTIIRNQVLEWRMLYFFLAGFAVLVGGLGWAAVLVLHRAPGWVRQLVLLPAVAYLGISTLMLLGYAEVYRLRYELDVQQVQALQPILTSPNLPADPVFIPINPDIRLTTREPAGLSVLDRVLFGAFEVPWAGQSALRMAYRHPDIQTIATHHWRPGMLFGVHRNGQGTILTVDGREVPLEKAIIFTYREGRPVLANELRIVTPDNQLRETVSLPIAASFAADGIAVDSLEVHSE